MRTIFLTLLAAGAIGIVAASNVSAAAINGAALIGAAQQDDAVTAVAGGCGRGWHRNRWGRCVRNW
jgi:hypothetical protein